MKLCDAKMGKRKAPNEGEAAATKGKRKAGKQHHAQYLELVSSAKPPDPASEEYSVACEAFVDSCVKALGGKDAAIKLLESMLRPLAAATPEFLAELAERDEGLPGTNFEPHTGRGLMKECIVRRGPHLPPWPCTDANQL